MTMNRRDAMKTIGLGASLPVLPHQHQHAPAMKRAATELKFLSPEQHALVEALAELIIPQTETPGARAAGVSYFIDDVLAAGEDGDRQSFLAGLNWLETRAVKLHGIPFLKLPEDRQVALLEPLAATGNLEADDQPGVRFFQRLKALTITGYYTSADGFVTELGFSNGFTGDYPGCAHPEHKQGDAS